ncbi:hypothetical protein M1N66_00240 [Thermodesulfovibrionales bacterium]|nr:hypothetical protein [Thermodesulfovibrionales bacterium]
MVRGSKKYKDIPIYAAPGLHEECFAIISDVCQQGAKIFDIAAGAGAFAARLKDANYCVYANDIDSKSWKAKEIPKTSFDLNNSVKDLFNVPISYLNDQKSILQAQNKKAPDRDKTL